MTFIQDEHCTTCNHAGCHSCIGFSEWQSNKCQNDLCQKPKTRPLTVKIGKRDATIAVWHGMTLTDVINQLCEA